MLSSKWSNSTNILGLGRSLYFPLSLCLFLSVTISLCFSFSLSVSPSLFPCLTYLFLWITNGTALPIFWVWVSHCISHCLSVTPCLSLSLSVFLSLSLSVCLSLTLSLPHLSLLMNNKWSSSTNILMFLVNLSISVSF